MALRRKPAGPVDRAVEELDRQIATLQRQLREHAPTGAGTPSVPRAVSPAATVAEFVKDALKPPAKSPPPPAKPRRDLFDVPADPMKDLEAEPIAFAPKPEPDLFASPPMPTRIDCAPKPEEKLAHYLSAGSIKSYKPLRHVQRKTRNRFFMWLGLSLVAVWLIWAVIR